jgi:small multidrug resistance pump
MSGAGLLWLSGAVAAFIAANTVLRTYASSGAGMTLAGALAFFLIGNLVMVRVMREGGLAIAVAISSVVQLVLLTAIAMAWFGERPTGLQLAGVALGIVSVALIVWPQGDVR